MLYLAAAVRVAIHALHTSDTTISLHFEKARMGGLKIVYKCYTIDVPFAISWYTSSVLCVI